MIKDKDPKKYLLTEGVDILFGGERVVPCVLPNGKGSRALEPLADKLRLTLNNGDLLVMERAENGGWTELSGDDARNAIADFESAEVSKRAPKD